MFHLKDFSLAYSKVMIHNSKIKNGSLSRKKGINAYVLTINSRNSNGLILLISMINGYMIIPKIFLNSLYNLID